MHRSPVFILFASLLALPAFCCSKDELSVFTPFIQKVECVQRWRKNQILMIVEKDCVPCHKLLERMRSEMPRTQK
ncbi:MAG: hypothetical protein ACKN9V_09095, partial [Pseudomonadota bacterium]